MTVGKFIIIGSFEDEKESYEWIVRAYQKRRHAKKCITHWLNIMFPYNNYRIREEE